MITTTMSSMIMSTTPSIDGENITKQLGVIVVESCTTGELMANIGERFMAQTKTARQSAIKELQAGSLANGADAIVGLRVDYTTIITGDHVVLMVTASGTAVKLG